MAESPGTQHLVCKDFNQALARLRAGGARLDMIWPADDPHTAVLTQEGRTIRLTSQPEAPGLPAALPAFRPGFVLTRAGATPGEGRAGMRYRDLIPGRLGGRYIASHIAIPEGGQVADWVHYHLIAFQLICVRRGWVRVVYEDQGAPFVMAPGDDKSGEFYIYDRKKGTFWLLALADDIFGGYALHQMRTKIREFRLLEFAANPAQLGGPRP